MNTEIRRQFDVDIDVESKVDRSIFGTRAIVYNETAKRILPHPSGVYLENIPVDSVTGQAAIDYKKGDEYGFFKVDILTNTTYDNFESKEELIAMSEKTPNWGLLKKRDIVEKLPHIAKHYDELQKISPTSVEELADFLALIRPGKLHLFDSYLEDKKGVQRKLYLRPSTGIYFKKSHAISYALMIVCLLNKVYDNGIVW